MSLIRGTPTLTANDSTAKHPLGTVWGYVDSTYGYRAYRYVRATGGAATVGQVATWNGSTGYGVGVAARGLAPAGIFLGSVTSLYYCWVQVYGHCTDVRTNGSVTSATGLICSAAKVAGPALSGTALLGVVFGTACTTDSGSRLTSSQLYFPGCASV